MQFSFIIKVAARNFFLNLLDLEKKKSMLLTAGSIGCRGKFKKKKETLIRMLNTALNFYSNQKFSFLFIKCYGFLKYRRAFLKTLQQAIKPFIKKTSTSTKKQKNKVNNTIIQQRFYYFESSSMPFGGCKLKRKKRK